MTEGSDLPKNYDSLFKQYDQHVCKQIKKINKFVQNFDDLHSYVWMKLIEANFLDRFEEYAQSQSFKALKTLTALEVCDFFGISWAQWIVAMSGYHKGLPKKYRYGEIVGRKKGHWMPTPVNFVELRSQDFVGYTSKKAVFDFEDIIQLSITERRLKGGCVRRPFLVMGREVKDGVVVGETRLEGDFKFPEVVLTEKMFVNYLSIAVSNHYSNFCRTHFRRHKERPHTPRENETTIWESTLPDNKSTKADTLIALSEARQMVSNTLRECLNDVKRPRKLYEPEKYEEEIFAQLEDGASIMKALRNSDLPQKVKKSLLNTVRPLLDEYID